MIDTRGVALVLRINDHEEVKQASRLRELALAETRNAKCSYPWHVLKKPGLIMPRLKQNTEGGLGMSRTRKASNAPFGMLKL